MLLLRVLWVAPAAAFFEQFFQQQQHQPQQHSVEDFERSFLDNDCDRYLCPDTQVCVAEPVDCPCPFGASQLKCVLPNGRDYVCIANTEGTEGDSEVRDCAWVNQAYYGKV